MKSYDACLSFFGSQMLLAAGFCSARTAHRLLLDVRGCLFQAADWHATNGILETQNEFAESMVITGSC